MLVADATPPSVACPSAARKEDIHSDLHVGAASNDNPQMPVPQDCSSSALSAQEAALEFMLFDLSSCLTPNSQPPPPVQ